MALKRFLQTARRHDRSGENHPGGPAVAGGTKCRMPPILHTGFTETFEHVMLE
jgi:hypothetical protein